MSTTSNINNKPLLLVIAILVSIVCYFVLAYQTERTNSVLLFSQVVLLFILYFYVIYQKNISDVHLKILVIASIFFRLIFFFSVPQLSDDYFRFIWDGRLINEGINPFLYLPCEVHEQSLLIGATNNELFTNMNSPNYYSIYPPILQAIFYIAAKFSFSNNYIAIIIIRVFLIFAELGTYFFLKRILSLLNFSKEKILIYILNPIVIIEITGNLHFEGVMLFFIIASIYYLLKNNLIFSSIFFSLAVCSKLVPLVLLPLIIKKVGLKNGIIYALVVLVLVNLMFLPFINQELINNLSNSVGLYFQKFEFNASLYYLARWIGFQMSGYNEIAIIGKILPVVSFAIITIISFYYKDKQSDEKFFEKALTILFVYYLFSLIIHPWYVTFLVLITVFVKQRFALIWSLLIFGTYLTYASLPYKENIWALWVEYIVVIGWFLIEKNKSKLA